MTQAFIGERRTFGHHQSRAVTIAMFQHVEQRAVHQPARDGSRGASCRSRFVTLANESSNVWIRNDLASDPASSRTTRKASAGTGWAPLRQPVSVWRVRV